MYVVLLNSLKSTGYHAGYIKDDFGCVKRPCECAGFALKDKTVIGMDYWNTWNDNKSFL